jgi:hypothetical protein
VAGAAQTPRDPPPPVARDKQFFAAGRATDSEQIICNRDAFFPRKPAELAEKTAAVAESAQEEH